MDVLQDNARILLEESSYPGELLAATHSLREAFVALTGIDDQAPDADTGAYTRLASGVAVAPVDAARCLVDFARTTTWLRGIRLAIEEALQCSPGERVRVLYAGCGPWATLALPLCTVFDPDQVAFTLLDIHDRSLVAARRLVDHFGLGDYMEGYECADATAIRLRQAPHVVIAETMQATLRREPQLALTANLAGQLAGGGCFIPERVEVFATAADLNTELALSSDPSRTTTPRPRRQELGRIFDLAPETAADTLARARQGRLPSIRLTVPDLPPDGEFNLLLRTRVTVHGEHVLGDYDSGLTYPVVVGEVGHLRGRETLEFTYLTGPEPGFETRRLGPPGIRGIEPADHLAVLAINLESEHRLGRMNGQRLEQLLRDPGHHRVLEVDGQIVGFLIALEADARANRTASRRDAGDPGAVRQVERVVVGDRYRRRGYASALYDDLFRHARERGVGEIVCEFLLEPPNRAAQAFLASFGFREIGQRESDSSVVSIQWASLDRT